MPTRERSRFPRWLKIVLPVAALIGIGGALSSEDDEDPSVVASDTTVAEGEATDAGNPTAASSGYSIGQTGRTGDFDVTVHGFKDPQPPGQFLRPDPGMHFVSVDVEVTNRTSRQQSFSSLLAFHLLDSANRQYDATIGDITPRAPNGEIPAGQALRGTVIFEVPDGATGLRIRVQGNLTASGAFFALS